MNNIELIRIIIGIILVIGSLLYFNTKHSLKVFENFTYNFYTIRILRTITLFILLLLSSIIIGAFEQ